MTYADTVLADTPLAYFPLTESGEAIGDTYADATGHGYDVHVQTGRLTHGPGPLPCTTAPVFPDFSVAPYDNADALLGSVTAGLPVDGQPYSLEGWLLPQVTGYAMQWVAYGPAGGITFIGGDIDIEPADVDHLHLSNYAASDLARNSYPIDAGDGRWHYIVITDDASGTVVFYVDGTAVQTFAVGSSNGLSFDAGNVLSIGDAGGHYGTLSPADDPYGGGIAQVAIYGHVLTAGRVAAHYAAALASVCPPDWVRLSHESGRGYWQSTGDVIEEWAGGVRQLMLPIPALSVPPAVFMGQDPVTNLPVFCPPPNVVQQVVNNYTNRTGQPNLAGGVTCVQVRCGAAQAMMTHFQHVYQVVTSWIKQILNWLGAAAATIVISGVAAFIDELTDGAGLLLSPYERGLLLIIIRRIPGVTGAALELFASSILSVGALDDMTKACFCALHCSGNRIDLDQAQMQTWQSAVARLPGTDFTGIQQDVCTGILEWGASFPDAITEWAQACQVGVAFPSTSCDSWTCP